MFSQRLVKALSQFQDSCKGFVTIFCPVTMDNANKAWNNQYLFSLVAACWLQSLIIARFNNIATVMKLTHRWARLITNIVIIPFCRTSKPIAQDNGSNLFNTSKTKTNKIKTITRLVMDTIFCILPLRQQTMYTLLLLFIIIYQNW